MIGDQSVIDEFLARQERRKNLSELFNLDEANRRHAACLDLIQEVDTQLCERQRLIDYWKAQYEGTLDTLRVKTNR